MTNDEQNEEIVLLNDILSELREVNTQLARVDERSRMNRSSMENMRENRIEPLENQADVNETRSRRNAQLIGAALTILTIFFGAALTFGFSAIPI